ncbi:PHD finger family protein [Striga asiatica]|uniref:PHD finger protein ALFIN-LIKE n=1 Tax=Striga asiatica TaxID=4170 RepID=A0A5A7R8K0_STRAF|nr:PHD finger family protein [Striga asiatica]
MEETPHPVPRAVEEVFNNFKGCRAGLLKALTTDVEKFYQSCDPECVEICLLFLKERDILETCHYLSSGFHRQIFSDCFVLWKSAFFVLEGKSSYRLRGEAESIRLCYRHNSGQ